MDGITNQEIGIFKNAISALIDIQFDILKLPEIILEGFEPSQIGTIVGTLMDASIPQLAVIAPDNKLLIDLGLTKHPGIIGGREGYPDYQHTSGVRAELKLLYVDPVDVKMKTRPTPREPSARITQKVTNKNVKANSDVLLVIAYMLKKNKANPTFFSPTITDLGVFSMINCINARDLRLSLGGGIWFGDYDTPTVLSKKGLAKIKRNEEVDKSTYGRKSGENKDYNEDTNFGKLNRIPYEPLQNFLVKHGYKIAKLKKAQVGQITLLLPEEDP